MFRTIIAALFSLALVYDFYAELNREEIRAASLFIKAFVIVACGYLFRSI